MPATEVEFDNGEESVDIIVDGRDMQEHFRMAHEAIHKSAPAEDSAEAGGKESPPSKKEGGGVRALGDPFQHAPRLKNECRQDNTA